ncbi:hypothetical protein ABIB26_003998 [Arthrobacter sp. UYEF20]
MPIVPTLINIATFPALAAPADTKFAGRPCRCAGCATPDTPTPGASRSTAPVTDDYQDNYLPIGLAGGTAEEALDTACGLYPNDPAAWT